MSPLISVCLICYNQEKYIEFALNSILLQKDVELEVIIADDFSTDKTKSIIQDFILNNHLNWKVLPSIENIGMQKNWQRCISSAIGRYVALLEGDDFWNDSLKLKKQVTLLEKDATLSGCFTNAEVINEVNNRIYPEYITEKKSKLSYTDFLKGNNIPTCSILFRNHEFEFPVSYFKSPYVDWIIHLFNTTRGDYIFLDEKSATYRLNTLGTYGGASEINRQEKLIKSLKCIKEIFKNKKDQEILKYRLKHEYQILAYLRKGNEQNVNFWWNKIRSRLI